MCTVRWPGSTMFASPEWEVTDMTIGRQPRGVVVNGGLLRQLRRRQGWTQQDLADIAQVTQRTVANAESGHAVALHTARGLADALRISMDMLCSELDAAHG